MLSRSEPALANRRVELATQRLASIPEARRIPLMIDLLGVARELQADTGPLQVFFARLVLGRNPLVPVTGTSQSERWGDSDVEIALLYRELRTLGSGPTVETQRTQLLARLRSLQAAEARRIGEWFEAHRPLPRGAVDEALKRAEALLASHGDAPGPDETR